MRILVLALLSVALLVPAFAQQPALNLMPMPASVQGGTGELLVTQDFKVALTGYDEPRLHRANERMLHTLSRQTGMTFAAGLAKESEAKLVVHCDHAGKPVQELGEDESYKVEVTPAGARLSAPQPLGVLRGLQTFLQLVGTHASGFSAPAVTIEDRPRFPWRGLLLDVCRHWMPVEVVKRTLDGMEAVKMNVLHWHLSEYQGFRVESKKFPKLQGMGSDGNYYTQAQVKDIIEYARDRGIRVVPEFDMPGHSTSWLVGYPELGSAPGPYQLDREWGVFDHSMDPTRESTYKFLDKFIAEMARLFPDQYFHIGGDEVTGKDWDANPKIQEFKRRHDMKTNADLQNYFNQRVEKLVKKHHKLMVGWDEVLHPALPQDVVIQSWRGPKGLAEAARAGHRVLLSNGYYLDLVLPAAEYYLNDPLSGDAASLSDAEKQLVLGGEACMWAEWVTPETVDSRIWPANAAVAERLWSSAEVRDVDSMYHRLAVLSGRLDYLGLTHNSNYRLMLQRIAGDHDITAVAVVADTLEPTKNYTRKQVDDDMFKPLIALVDAVRPESLPARRFSALVDRVLARTASEEEKSALRQQLICWRDNDLRLHPLFAESFLLKDDAVVSQNLSAVAEAGLQALDYLQADGVAPAAWRDAQLAVIANAAKPQQNLLLVVTAPIEKLVQATQAR